jgi:hypothetical protein
MKKYCIALVCWSLYLMCVANDTLEPVKNEKELKDALFRYYLLEKNAPEMDIYTKPENEEKEKEIKNYLHESRKLERRLNKCFYTTPELFLPLAEKCPKQLDRYLGTTYPPNFETNKIYCEIYMKIASGMKDDKAKKYMLGKIIYKCAGSEYAFGKILHQFTRRISCLWRSGKG